jgi:hypothetical protein
VGKSRARNPTQNPTQKPRTVLIKVKIKKKKPTQLSTLNHSHAVVAPQRESSTHHTLLHHSKVHPPHAAVVSFYEELAGKENN